MPEHADKAQAAQAREDTQRQRSGQIDLRFGDNRPEAIAQRKLQAMANNSPQVKKLQALQAMANNGPQAGQFQASQEIVDRSPQVQKEKSIQSRLATVQQQRGPAQEGLLQGKLESVQRLPLASVARDVSPVQRELENTSTNNLATLGPHKDAVEAYANKLSMAVESARDMIFTKYFVHVPSVDGYM